MTAFRQSCSISEVVFANPIEIIVKQLADQFSSMNNHGFSDPKDGKLNLSSFANAR